MPISRKSPGSHYKHHPYLFGARYREVYPYGQRDYRISRSMHNISRSGSLYSERMPRSMSAIDENTEGWKLPFCGVLSSDTTDNNLSYGIEDTERYNYCRPKSTMVKEGIKIPRSCSYQTNRKSASSPLSSTPIPVPRRGGKKRKGNSRSSGGYFFDKYMKRFRSKCRSKKNSIADSEEAEDLVDDKAKPVVINITSNRQDLVCDESVFRVYHDTIHQNSEEVYNPYDQDDLYPLRYGTSSKWDTMMTSVPRSATKDSGCGTSEASEPVSRNEYFSLTSSVFPADPPRVWGDASFYDLDDIYAQPVSPVPSVSDTGDASCRYSDSNSETLKAMETLYLCNFQVAIEGDWLCLKEICDDAVASNALIASTVQGCDYLTKLSD